MLLCFLLVFVAVLVHSQQRSCCDFYASTLCTAKALFAQERGKLPACRHLISSLLNTVYFGAFSECSCIAFGLLLSSSQAGS
jgi:ABC-type Fe3+ transport system permease subunit